MVDSFGKKEMLVLGRKASLKWQRTPETTTDTQDMSEC